MTKKISKSMKSAFPEIFSGKIERKVQVLTLRDEGGEWLINKAINFHRVVEIGVLNNKSPL